MFRKPKKKPAALRGAAGGGGDVSNNNQPASKKRRRARADSSSSEDDGGDNDGEDTSDLLQQLRKERDDAKSGKGSAPLLNTSSTSTKKKSKDGTGANNWMHQYKSNSGAGRTAQEEATRTAEYHPAEKTGDGDDGNADSAKSRNAQIAALQKAPRNAFHAGPLRATTFVRTTARFDYQPDICKDYKETGFCGFGDTCIYLHDRGDTKSGWQMEAEYEEKKKREEDRKSKEMEQFMNSMMCGDVNDGGGKSTTAAAFGGDGDTGGSNTDDGIPFACHICRSSFDNPVVTTCSHYFCEKCLLSRIREEGTGCPICQKDTHGVMNHPQKLIAKKRRLVGRDGGWDEYLEKSKRSGDDDS